MKSRTKFEVDCGRLCWTLFVDFTSFVELYEHFVVFDFDASSVVV